MGDVNQLEWVRRNLPRIRAPILEIGSKSYGPVSMNYRGLLAGCGTFVGTDMSAGDGVDVVADLTSDYQALPDGLRQTPYRTILCLSVMEHVRDIYKFAATLRRLLAPDGVLFLSVPWVWRFHGYPSDYWRISPEALKFLMEPLSLDAASSCLSYQPAGEVAPLSTEVMATYPDYERDTAPPSRLGRAALRLFQGVARRISPRFGRASRRVLYPVMVNAVFQRSAA